MEIFWSNHYTYQGVGSLLPDVTVTSFWSACMVLVIENSSYICNLKYLMKIKNFITNYHSTIQKKLKTKIQTIEQTHHLLLQ